MIVLDTNVISEGFRVRPSEIVCKWLDAQDPADLFLCAPVLAELRFGIERLPGGGRRHELDRFVATIERDLFGNRILSFDREGAYEFGRIVAKRSRIGEPISPMDAMIAAIALANGMAIATWDIQGFRHIGIELINPFEPSTR